MSDGRIVEGIAVPYGQRVELRAGLWEAFAPGAFAVDVAAWNARSDGARVPFVTSHPGEGDRRVIGTVEELRDTPEGVRFRARLVDTPAAREYADLVRAGANGVSVEFAPVGLGRPDRDGTLRHRAARLLAIAGAVAPAYDSARVAVRSRRADGMSEQIRPEDDPGTTDEETTTQDEGNEGADTTSAPEQARSRTSAVAGRVTIPDDRERRSRESSAVARMAGSSPARITRSELVYTREGEHRFLRDGLRASTGDMDAYGRLGRHYAILEDIAKRAASVVTGDIAGTYPAEYVPGLLVDRLLKGRPAGSFFQRVPVTDARTRTWPKVTEHTVVHKQVTEGVNEAVSGFATVPVSTTPGMLMGMVDVSRQVIDGGDPDAERMILDDLMESYSIVSEGEIVAGLIAGATQGTHPIVSDEPHDAIVGSLASFPTTRMLPAEGVFLPAAAFEGLLLQQDLSGRPMVPYVGPSNAEGTAGGAGATASVLGVPVYNAWSIAAADAIVARRQDAFYYESSVVQFRYEQIGGPAAIRIGVWAYLVAVVRRAEGVIKETVSAPVP